MSPHLVQLSELAELIPQIALFARAAEVPHPHLRSRHVTHFACVGVIAGGLRAKAEGVEGGGGMKNGTPRCTNLTERRFFIAGALV